MKLSRTGKSTISQLCRRKTTMFEQLFPNLKRYVHEALFEQSPVACSAKLFKLEFRRFLNCFVLKKGTLCRRGVVVQVLGGKEFAKNREKF
jgi:hypothetical protein